MKNFMLNRIVCSRTSSDDFANLCKYSIDDNSTYKVTETYKLSIAEIALSMSIYCVDKFVIIAQITDNQ